MLGHGYISPILIRLYYYSKKCFNFNLYINIIRVGMYTISKVSDGIGIIKLIPVLYRNDR